MVAGLVALLTIHEFLKLTESYGVQPMRWPTHLFAALFFVTLAVTAASDAPLLSTGKILVILGFLAAIAPFIFLTRAMKDESLSAGYPAAAASVFAFAY